MKNNKKLIGALAVFFLIFALAILGSRVEVGNNEFESDSTERVDSEVETDKNLAHNNEDRKPEPAVAGASSGVYIREHRVYDGYDYHVTETEDCRDLDGRDCDGDWVIERKHHCVPSGNCNEYTTDYITNCDTSSGWVCSGSTTCVYRDYTCSGGNCTYSPTASGDCSDVDGWYCEMVGDTDNDDRVKMEHTCSGGGCDGQEVDRESLGDENEDWSFNGYGDRVFCYGDTDPDTVCAFGASPSPPFSEARSTPIAHNLTWENEDDHNYQDSSHEPFDNHYPYCGSDNPHSVHLSWEYHSQTDHGKQSSEVRIKDADTNEIVYGPQELSSGINSINVGGSNFDFDTEYTWEVRVTDENGYTSEWFSSTFETDKNRANPDFSWQPNRPYIEEKTYFTDESTSGAEPITTYEWEFEEANPSTATGTTAETEFIGDYGTKEARLKVTDNEGVSCGIIKGVFVRPVLPDWQEVY